MRRLFITHIVCCLIFLPYQSIALVSGAATRTSTAIISSISSAGATYGGASGSKIVATATRSFAAGYAASASGVIASGAAGGYEATAAVALSRGATGGLLRLAFQGLSAGSKMIPYVGAVITAASLAGMAWDWYQGEDGKNFFRKFVGSSIPVPEGFIIGTYTINIPEICSDSQHAHFNGGKLIVYNNSIAYAAQPYDYKFLPDYLQVGIKCTGTTYTPYQYKFLQEAAQQCGHSVRGSRIRGNDILLYCDPAVTVDPNSIVTPVPVPWDDVQKAIEDDLGNRPNEWADPFADAMKEVPPAVNPWLDETSKEDAAKPAPNPMPDVLPYPTPNNTPSVPHPSTGEPVPAPLPNELTKEDISKVASEILKSMSPSQTNNVATGDVTQPTPNQDLATQIATAIKNNSPSIPQPPYDVKVINEPTIKIKTEDSWKSDAESAVGSETQPDSNEDLDLNLDLEKYKSKKRDLSFLDTIYFNIKSLPLFQLFEKTPISVSGGSSQFCLDVPQFGQHCIDLDDYSNAFDTLGSVSIALCFFACLAIIFL